MFKETKIKAGLFEHMAAETAQPGFTKHRSRDLGAKLHPYGGANPCKLWRDC
jgi:hypothetical protein